MPLRVAAALVMVEGVLVVMYGVVEAFHVHSSRLALGATAAIFFVAYGVFLGWCAIALHRAQRWSRGPVLLSQLILLGLAWNFATVHLWGLTVPMVLGGLVVLAGVLHPESIDALERDE